MSDKDEAAFTRVVETLEAHIVTQEPVPYSVEWTSTCKTCGTIDDSPKSRSTHPAEMVLLALGMSTPEYKRL